MKSILQRFLEISVVQELEPDNGENGELAAFGQGQSKPLSILGCLLGLGLVKEDSDDQAACC